jgi:Cu(I)/Ag(I) efflux system membrane fusion protein
MNHKKANITLGLALIAVVGAFGYGLYALGMQRGMQGAAMAPMAPAPTKAAPQSVAEGIEATRRHIGAGIKAG